MRIAAVSDTHGSVDAIISALRRQSADHLLFAGDYYRDGIYIAEQLGIPVDAVPGNCDAGCSEGREKLLEFSSQRILLVHGHQYGVKRDLQRLYYRAQELEVQAVVFGHTHLAICEQQGGLWFINPGSPVHPRIAGQESFAILELEGSRFWASIIHV